MLVLAFFAFEAAAGNSWLMVSCAYWNALYVVKVGAIYTKQFI